MQNIRTLYASLRTHFLNWSTAVKRGSSLAPLLLRAVVLVVGSLSVTRVKITFGFARRCASLHRYLGPKGLAMYLKTCFVLLQQSIGGMKDTAPSAIGMNIARNRQGIPRIIDRRDRHLIRLGDVSIIRLWLTMFGLYRVLEFRGKLKLHTITSPGLDLSANGVLEMWRKWVPVFIRKAALESDLQWKINLKKDLTPYSIPLIQKASPNSGGLAAVAAIPLDIVRWCLEPEHMLRSFSRYLQEVDGLELVWGLKPLIQAIQSYVIPKLEIFCTCVRISPFKSGIDPQRAHHGPWKSESKVQRVKTMVSPLAEEWGPVTALGSLGFKHEPGKIRVFAMVDVLTQTLLKPLHKWLFGRLKGLGTDGTFDQYAPLERLVKRMNDPCKAFVASYDLSAATDRLPLSLQMMILEECGSAAFAKHWGNLLVGRSYRLPKEAKSWNLGFDSVTYTVGQPMGALSSWAMLAVTHHAIVQLAAARALKGYNRQGWFQDYAVLGDDIVIANKAVANEYLYLMNLIGVEIGLAKSLVSSQGTFEFAKRTYFRGQDVSPVSLAEVVVSLRNLSSLLELVRKNLKFEKIRVATVARFAGFGFRNLARLQTIWAVGNRLGRLSAILHSPGSIWPVEFIRWISAVGPGGAPGKDLNLWRAATGLWNYLVGIAVDKLVTFERLLPHYDLYSYSYGENRKVTKKDRESPGWNPGRIRNGGIPVLGFLADGKPLTKILPVQVFNDFFSEWVTRPFHKGLWASYAKINDTLRTIDPYTTPKWTDLDSLWSELFSYKSMASSVPASIKVLSRQKEETKDISDGGRTLRLWLKLRKIVTSRLVCDLSLVCQSRQWPKAARRWDRGLGQDRVNMGHNTRTNTHPAHQSAIDYLSDLFKRGGVE